MTSEPYITSEPNTAGLGLTSAHTASKLRIYNKGPDSAPIDVGDKTHINFSGRRRELKVFTDITLSELVSFFNF